jgi:hypothetical protein
VLGVVVPAESDLDLDIPALIGRKVRALIVGEPGKKDPSRKFARIKNLLKA